jgi:hypothetical protein
MKLNICTLHYILLPYGALTNVYITSTTDGLNTAKPAYVHPYYLSTRISTAANNGCTAYVLPSILLTVAAVGPPSANGSFL